MLLMLIGKLLVKLLIGMMPVQLQLVLLVEVVLPVKLLGMTK